MTAPAGALRETVEQRDLTLNMTEEGLDLVRGEHGLEMRLDRVEGIYKRHLG